jgi:hypothetical protein
MKPEDIDKAILKASLYEIETKSRCDLCKSFRWIPPRNFGDDIRGEDKCILKQRMGVKPCPSFNITDRAYDTHVASPSYYLKYKVCRKLLEEESEY